MIQGDDFLKSSISELYSLQMTKSAGTFEAKDKSPQMLEKLKKLDLLKKDLLVYINNNKSALTLKINDINNEINYYENIIKKIPKSQRDILNITRKLDVNEKMYLFLLEKRANTVIARAGIVSESKVIESARSIGVVKPDKNRIYVMFLLGGLVISFLVIMIRLILLNKIQNYEELKQYTDLPIYGEIIYAREAESNYNLAENNPKAPITESFRTVRTNLEYLVIENKCKSIVITSHNPGEGKTFCSINLSSIIAKAGKKVLLLEFDLHKPKIHKGMNLSSDIGLSNLLAGKIEIENIIVKSHIDNLDVILSGPTPPNASELILSKHLNKIFEYANENYDYVIVDTPPIGLISDALILMKKADATLFVLNVKYAKSEFVNNAVDLVSLNKIKNFGFILNGVKIKKSKYYYNYGYGYGYGYEGNK
jgi:capsular exopolysaccharide synthesis family protein